MSEKQVIEASLKPITKKELIEDLKRIGIKSGDVLLVHSSLSKIGWVCGKEITVIEALLDDIGEEGILVMPSFSGENSDPSLWQNPPVPASWVPIIKTTMPPFDPEKTPTREMGRIADAFWRFPGVKRSMHPQVSFSAIGKEATYLLADHSLSPGFGEDSPLFKLYQMNAKILLLGVEYDHCTALHLGEVMINDPDTYIQTGSCILENGHALWKEYREIAYDDSDFLELGRDYEANHPVIIGKIGQATSRLLYMKPLCDYSKQWLLKHRYQK